MNNKAITPLISTILLLVFAIGLGTLVMSWGNSEHQKMTSCEDTALSITELNSSKEICLEGTNIKTVLENNGNSHIESLEMIMLTSDSVITQEIDVDIKPKEFKHLVLPSEIGDISKILKIRLIPNIDSGSCVEKRVEIERIEGCK